VVLAGKGIAALQHAGKLPVGPLDLPAIPSLACTDVAGRDDAARAGAVDRGAVAYSRRRERHAT